MKLIYKIIVTCLFLSATSARSEVVGEYGIHLFFNEKEFVDVMKVQRASDGSLTGDMHVPNDFDGPLSNFFIDGKEVKFDLFVPKNAARPSDLIFEYRGRFFDETHSQLIGFVTIKGEEKFVASFVAFKRQP